MICLTLSSLNSRPLALSSPLLSISQTQTHRHTDTHTHTHTPSLSLPPSLSLSLSRPRFCPARLPRVSVRLQAELAHAHLPRLVARGHQSPDQAPHRAREVPAHHCVFAHVCQSGAFVGAGVSCSRAQVPVSHGCATSCPCAVIRGGGHRCCNGKRNAPCTDARQYPLYAPSTIVRFTTHAHTHAHTRTRAHTHALTHAHTHTHTFTPRRLA